MPLASRLRSTGSRLRPPPGAGPRAVVAVPVALGVVLVLVLAVGLLLRGRATSAGLAAVPDTGPVLVGVPLPADGSAGPATVTLSPAAAAHPRAEQIRALVQRSIDARNARDHDAWSDAVESRTDEAAFAAQTRTQRLGSVVLRRIDPVAAGEVVVPAGVISTQDPADAPADVRVPRLCWQVTMVVLPGTPPRLLDPRPGSALRTPC